MPECGLLVGGAVPGAAVDAVVVIGPGATVGAGGHGTDGGEIELIKIKIIVSRCNANVRKGTREIVQPARDLRALNKDALLLKRAGGDKADHRFGRIGEAMDISGELGG